MMYVIQYYNAHLYYNAGECVIFGPLPDLDAAKARLTKLVENKGDPLFKIDPDPDAVNNGTYAGYSPEDLAAADRDEDLASEIWAEIVELTPPD